LAVLSHDPHLVGSLCRTPLELIRRSSTKGPEFHDLFVEAVQAVWTKIKDAPARIAAALAATDPSRADVRTPEWDKYWWIPQLDLLSCLAKRPGDFQETLMSALCLHKEYFSKSRDRRAEAWGFLALGPMAFTTEALNRGLSLDVQSEYLPMRLISGNA
jgi:hypothetical protein